MAARRSDPHKLDVAALADEASGLDGELDASALGRWHEMQSPPADMPLQPVRWSARAERRQVSGAPPQLWLHLCASAQAWPVCQRCLQPFTAAVEVDRAFRFVQSESEAELLDADSEDDVLALSPSFNLVELIEDELLLAWPLVPRHERCAQPAHQAGAQAAASPFAALAPLKGRAAKP